MSVKDNSFGIALLQEKMLDILKFFVSICEKNGLQYWAGGGTCLGSLRHQGFIPWDDDLDVFMPRADYEKLWDIWKENKNEKYILCRTTCEKNYHHRVMQIVDTSTTFINKRSASEDIEHGVYIDIIPMDACAGSFWGKCSQIYNAIIFSIYNIQCVPEFQGGCLMRAGTRFLLWVVPDSNKRYHIWKNAEKRMTKYDWENAKYAVELTTSFKSLLRPWPKKWFETKKAQFEDILINIPAGAESYMQKIYGDYMKLPPKEEQCVRHNTVFIDLENSYTNYRGKYFCCQK